MPGVTLVSSVNWQAACVRRYIRTQPQARTLWRRTRHGQKLAESRADDIVRETRLTVRRIPGTEIFRRILEVADDAADEDSAFVAELLSGEASCLALPAPLLGTPRDSRLA